jgi:thiamine-phosphate pyrophosphorylase
MRDPRRNSLAPLYAITDRELSGLSHAEQVRRLAMGGATLIQLREKRLSADAFYNEAIAAMQVAREFGVKLIINDRVDIALACDADGVHLGQDDLPPAAARELMGERAVIGFSTHNREQALSALQLPVDYIALGPIFKTLTKSDPDPLMGIQGLSSIRPLIDRAVVAIGGIDHSNAADVLAAGADSVAMISGLVSDPSLITERVRELINIIHTSKVDDNQPHL